MSVSRSRATEADPSIPAGEQTPPTDEFTADAIAAAFEIDVARVHRALAGEFAAQPDTRVNSSQAQQLAEVLLGDQPLAERQAALMRLGAFTPRADHDWGLGETRPGEESDRLAATADEPDDERASQRASHDPGQPHG